MNGLEIILIILIMVLFIKDIIKMAFFIGTTLGIAILFTNVHNISFSDSIPISLSGVIIAGNIVYFVKPMILTIMKSVKLFRKNGKASILTADISFIVSNILAYFLFMLSYLNNISLKNTVIFIALTYLARFIYKSIRELFTKHFAATKTVVYIGGSMEEEQKLSKLEKLANKDILTLYIGDNKEDEQSINKLKDLAYKDVLTGVGNRTSYEDMVEKFEKNEKSMSHLGIFVFDINNLKMMNDKYGHKEGDLYIKDCVNLILKVFNEETVYRVGGDEFITIIENTTHHNLEILKSKLDIEFSRTQGTDRPLSSAYGYSFSGDTNISYSDLFNQADENMYLNKKLQKEIANNANSIR